MSELELNFVHRDVRQGFSLVEQLTLTLESKQDPGGKSADLIVSDLELFD